MLQFTIMKIISKSNSIHGKITIRCLQRKDLEQLHNFINTISQEKTFSLFQGEYISFKEEQDFLEQTLENIKQHEEVFLVMYCDHKLIGIASLEKLELAQQHLAKLGILIEREFRGSGLGKLLLKSLFKQAKKDLNLKIVTAEVFSNNIPAINLYQKMGFKEYGKLPKGLKYRGKYQDCLLMYKVFK
jgi:RimJ/RimL family protein N-acetyltransferase